MITAGNASESVSVKPGLAAAQGLPHSYPGNVHLEK